MTTETLTLTDFLLARIAEDETVAQESRMHEHLNYRDAPYLNWRRDESGYGQIVATSGRVLAECEAKRRIVKEHWDCAGACGTCGTSSGAADTFAYAVDWPCLTIRLLALPYADHPDHNPDWRP